VPDDLTGDPGLFDLAAPDLATSDLAAPEPDAPDGADGSPLIDAPVRQPGIDEAAPPPPDTLARASLADRMSEGQVEQVVAVTRAFLERRFRTVREMVDVASTDVNLNPFLMLAMAPAYNIYSPFEAAEYAQYAKLPHGDATAFGRFVEERIFPIFGAGHPPEKPRPGRDARSRAAESTLFSSIDGDITVEGTRYLLTYKSGPWTMNESHQHEMSERFPQVYARTGCEIIIAITYGRRERVNNKPAKVMRRTGPYVHTLVGKDLWEFITGVRDGHLQFFRGIREAQRQFAIDHGGKTFHEHLIEARLQLAESFRQEFGLVGADDDMWERIFKGSF
jgi:hypothetical protein